MKKFNSVKRLYSHIGKLYDKIVNVKIIKLNQLYNYLKFL